TFAESRPRPLKATADYEVRRIAREALRNAFLHSGARTVTTRVEYGPDVLRLTIDDDGVGIDAATLGAGREGHFGLAGMRERAQRIGGVLAIGPGPVRGTRVALTIPG